MHAALPLCEFSIDRMYLCHPSQSLSLEVIDISIVLSLRYLSVILVLLVLLLSFLPFSSSWVSSLLSRHFVFWPPIPLFGRARRSPVFPSGSRLTHFVFFCIHASPTPLSLICFSSLVILPHNFPSVVSSLQLSSSTFFLSLSSAFDYPPSLLSLLLSSSYASKYPLFHLTSRV